MPHWNVDHAFDQFKHHRTAIETASGSNEATTRLRAIDTLVFEVLGWDRQDVDAETYVRDEGYADYALCNGEEITCVIEAKRDGQAFVLSGVDYSEKAVSFGLLAKESSAARKAMIQAAGYAASLGARYVAITNGHQ